MFLASHAALRLVLAIYTGTAAHELAFKTGHGGRPELAWPGGAPPVRFNLTHTSGLFAVSLTRSEACGVDAERLCNVLDDALLDLVLTPSERARIGDLARNAAIAEFYKLWTRKEAVLKALGVGLKVDPRCVSVNEDGPVYVNDPAVGPHARTRCWIRTFHPTPEHVVSVAIDTVTEYTRLQLVELDPTLVTAKLA